MKTRILSIFSAVAVVLGAYSCQKPEPFRPNIDDPNSPTGVRAPITNLRASFLDDDRDENLFTSEIDIEKHTITVVFPYNYPRLSDNVLETSMLTKMRVMADLDNNVYVSPSLMFMDLSKENYIDITDQTGVKSTYTVKAEIRKSAECAITKYDIPSLGLTGIVNENMKKISLISIDPVGKELADISISHGAAISPDPSATALDYTNAVKVTVTAQNGVDKAEYTIVTEVPEKIDGGLRKGSAKLLWARKITEIGLTAADMQTGVATTPKYVVVNERKNSSAVYLDLKTGANVGTIDVSDFAGNLTNFYVTSDNAGNVFFNSFASAAGGSFKIWRVNDFSKKPEIFIDMTAGAPMGRKISIVGDVDKDAIITAPYHGFNGQFGRWQIKNGEFVSQSPVLVTAEGLGSWGNNADVVYTDPSDIQSDYFAAYYTTPRHHSLFSGVTNQLKSAGPDISSNWICNAADYAEFNKSKYFAANSVNSFTWGTDDSVYLYDGTSGTLVANAVDFSANGVDVNGNYGAKALGLQNGNGTGDVKLQVSADGYYMYIVFMFTNGYVGCVQVDCIKM